MSAIKINKKLTNIIENLNSDNEKKVISAISQLRNHGKKEAILPLIKKLRDTNNTEIKKAITNLLFDLKNQTVVDTLIPIIKDDNFINEKPTLISIFWQSTLDGSQYIATFINEAIKGNYLVGIEVLSVIDNFDATFQETEIEDIRFDLEDAIENETTEKKELLISIKSAINTLNLEF